MRTCCEAAQGDALLTASTALAIALAQGRTEEELGVLAAFFVALGDGLALLALHRPGCSGE